MKKSMSFSIVVTFSQIRLQSFIRALDNVISLNLFVDLFNQFLNDLISSFTSVDFFIGWG